MLLMDPKARLSTRTCWEQALQLDSISEAQSIPARLPFYKGKDLKRAFEIYRDAPDTPIEETHPFIRVENLYNVAKPLVFSSLPSDSQFSNSEHSQATIRP
jgi:hypothetical protein